MSGLPLQRPDFVLSESREDFHGKSILNKYRKGWCLNLLKVDWETCFLKLSNIFESLEQYNFFFSADKLIKHLLGEHNRANGVDGS